jgi:hypothetical protein
VNEYTRREEVRWTFIASLALVICVAPAVVLLVTAKGATVPDPAAQLAATAAADRETAAHVCTKAADGLATEVDVFKKSGKAAHLDADTADAGAPKAPVKRSPKGKPPPAPEKPPNVSLAWPAAQPSYKQAKALAPCRVPTDAAVTRADTAAAWDAVTAAAAVTQPADDNPDAQVDAARSLLKIFADAPVDRLVSQTRDAEAAVQTASTAAAATAAKATIVEPLPEGILPRRAAVGIGVGLSVIALLLSYLSVRMASMRRLATLAPLREAARAGQPGMHAAAVLKLAAQHNGGEPGLVIGGAIGGVLASLKPTDADLFIAGVMAGMIVGLATQWLYRLLVGAARWRSRAAELSEIEKPTIPIVLVLSGVNAGLEKQFITYFNGLSPVDAAQMVEKLASQAEERILAAADAGAAGPPQQPMYPPAAMPR